MKHKRLVTLLGSICLTLVLAALPFMAACPAPAPPEEVMPTPPEEAPLEPIELSYAYSGPPHGAIADGIKWWVDEVAERTGGAVTIKVYWGGTLARAMEIPDAVRTGTADMGDTVWAPYFPERFPIQIMTDWALPVFNRSQLARWLAFEQLAKEFPEVDEELAAKNMKRLTYYGVSNIHLISRNPIRSLEDFKGLKVRCSGHMHPPLLEAVGGVPIFIPSVEAYDALEKGVIDGSTCTADWAVSYKYHEAAKYLIRVGMGGDPGLGVMINLDVWNQLPQSVQQVFMELREEYPFAAEEIQYEETFDQSYPALEEAGVEIIDLPEADLETWKNLPICMDLGEQWIEFVVDTGALSESRAREMLERYIDLEAEFAEQYPRAY